jgi:hypothetical protein
MTADRSMTLAEWGESIGIKPTSAWRKFRAGEVDAINVGSRLRPRLRVTPKAAEAYLEAREREMSRGRA